jgi:peptide/nickel transport system substrate-binding protein
MNSITFPTLPPDNWGGYVNPRVAELLALIPGETDQVALVEYYTELTDVPSFTLMYRPDQFYTVNETVWTDYPASDDGCNVPPMNLLDGYGVAGLYFITQVNPQSVISITTAMFHAVWNIAVSYLV